MSIPTSVRADQPAPSRRPLIGLVPYLAWEAVLLVVLVAVAVAAATAEAPVLAANAIWSQFAVLGFIAVALALSLRTGTPNLAVAAFASLAGMWFADRVSTGGSVFGATLTVVFTCLMIGLIMGAVVGLTSVPAWAVSLGAGAVIQGGLLAAYGSQLVPLRDRDAGLQGSDFIVWTALFMVVSLAGAATFALPAVRGALTPGRPAVEEAGFSGGRLLRAIVGLGGSSALAALAGVLLTRRIQAGSPVATDLLVVGLAVVVLGGVSVYGRRGGVAGVALAVLLVALVRHWMTVEGAEAATQYMVSGVLLVVGLLVSWGLDLVARRAERL